MRPRTAAYVVLPAAVAAGVYLAWWFAEGPGAPEPPSPDGPVRCAAFSPEASAADYTRKVDTASEGLTLGVLADARGAAPRTLDNLRAAADAFRERDVQLLLSLGGMGRTKAELRAVFEIVTDDAPWKTIASPGAQENLRAHRDALRALNDERVYDGSRVRIVRAGAIAIATLPGAANASQLWAGRAGCAFRDRDLEELRARIEDSLSGASRPDTLVWAGYPPPRQRGPRASDRARGLHMGRPAATRAARAAGADFYVHGKLDGAALATAEGERTLARDRIVGLAPGPAEAMPIHSERGRATAWGSALVAHVEAGSVSWERLDLGGETERPEPEKGNLETQEAGNRPPRPDGAGVGGEHPRP